MMTFCVQSKTVRYTRVFVLFLLFAFVVSAKADVKPAGIFSSDMVLQRNQPIVVWGWAEKGERISVTFNQVTRKVRSDNAGKWKVVFPEMQAGGPYELKIQGKNLIVLNNILVGDIWICSGQSNMGFAVKNANDGEKEIAAANYPSIRIVTV